MSPSTPLLLYFSNLPEIVFLLVRDRLCHRPSFLLVAYHWPRTVYLPCRPLECSSTLISSGLFCFPYLLVLPESHFICKYILQLPFFLPPLPLLSLRLLSRFLKFLFFNLHFSEWLSFSIVRSHRDALHFAHLFQFSLDLLILSINQISPPFFIRHLASTFLSFRSSPDVSLGVSNIKALHLLSFHPLRARRSALPILFPHSLSLVDDFTCLSPTNMYSLLVAFTTSRTFYASFSPLLCLRREYPSARREDVIPLPPSLG